MRKGGRQQVDDKSSCQGLVEPTSISIQVPQDTPQLEEDIILMSNTASSHQCDHCGTKNSPLWRRGRNGELLCNACGLYWKHNGVYRSLGQAENRKSAQCKDVFTGQMSSQEPRRAPERESRRRSGRTGNSVSDPSSFMKLPQVRKPSKTFRTVVIPKAQIPYGTLLRLKDGQSRLEPLEFDAQSVPELKAKVKYVMNRGRMIFQGDHAAIQCSDGNIYFVLVKNFFVDENGNQLFSFSWLIPKDDTAHLISSRFEYLDPGHFRVGSDHSMKEPVSSIVFVFYSPFRTPKVVQEASAGNGEAPRSSGEMIIEEVSAAHTLCDF